MTFGPGVGPEVIVDVPGGRTVAFKGKGDRVDRGDDGAAVITDYKTGSTWDYGNVDSDPVDRGRKLQLPVYGLAARSRFGDVAVRARYWFVSQKANFGVVGYDLTDERLERFRQVVGTIVDGIETGLFPANPGAERNGDFEHCHYCDFKPICPVDRDRDWERVRTDAVLQEYVSLAEGPGGTP
jgi:RecB family exonuclease